jgi:hypothetical protein
MWFLNENYITISHPAFVGGHRPTSCPCSWECGIITQPVLSRLDQIDFFLSRSRSLWFSFPLIFAFERLHSGFIQRSAGLAPVRFKPFSIHISIYHCATLGINKTTGPLITDAK